MGLAHSLELGSMTSRCVILSTCSRIFSRERGPIRKGFKDTLKKLTPEDKIAILSSEDENVFDIKYSIREIPRTTNTVFIGNEDPRISLVSGVPALNQQNAILERIHPIYISTECRYRGTYNGTPPINWDYPGGLNKEKSPLKYSGSIQYLSKHYDQLFRKFGNALEAFL